MNIKPITKEQAKVLLDLKVKPVYTCVSNSVYGSPVQEINTTKGYDNFFILVNEEKNT